MNQLTLELVFVIVGLVIYRYGISNKQLINTLSILVLIVLVSRQAMAVTPYGYIVYKLGVMGLGVAYWNRFKEKHKKKTLDYIKCGILIMLMFYPLNALFFGNRTANGRIFFQVFTIITIVFATGIIIRDKWNIEKSGVA